jgi:hypothetical protein
MTDAPFTETHREPQQLAADLRVRAECISGLDWEAPATASMMREAAAALDAALAEIDRLGAENLALWTERQARIFPEQLRQAEAARRKT